MIAYTKKIRQTFRIWTNLGSFFMLGLIATEHFTSFVEFTKAIVCTHLDRGDNTFLFKETEIYLYFFIVIGFYLFILEIRFLFSSIVFTSISYLVFRSAYLISLSSVFVILNADFLIVGSSTAIEFLNFIFGGNIFKNIAVFSLFMSWKLDSVSKDIFIGWDYPTKCEYKTYIENTFGKDIEKALVNVIPFKNSRNVSEVKAQGDIPAVEELPTNFFISKFQAGFDFIVDNSIIFVDNTLTFVAKSIMFVSSLSWPNTILLSIGMFWLSYAYFVVFELPDINAAKAAMKPPSVRLTENVEAAIATYKSQKEGDSVITGAYFKYCTKKQISFIKHQQKKEDTFFEFNVNKMLTYARKLKKREDLRAQGVLETQKEWKLRELQEDFDDKKARKNLLKEIAESIAE